MPDASTYLKLHAMRSSWTCALEDFAGVSGTGVLVGPDLVLTNYHVVEGLGREGNRLADAKVHFDFLEEQGGRRVDLAQTWLVAQSAYSTRDLDPLGSVDANKLDYAVVRIAAKIGNEAAPTGETNVSRGWLVLPAPETRPAANTPIMMFHHPVSAVLRAAGERRISMPLQFTPGVIVALEDGGTRVTHTARTEHGSSGAVCYGLTLEPVALHHSGEPESRLAARRPGQRAIPLGLIADHLRRTNPAIYGETLPSCQPPQTVPAAPGREQVANAILLKRHRAAMVLLDRDASERDILYARKKHNGLVHVLACRQVDSHLNLLTRLREASFATEDLSGEEVQSRISGFLTGRLKESGWLEETVPPATQREPKDAAELIIYDISRRVSPRTKTTIVISAPIERVDPAREKQVVRKVAEKCKALAANCCFQVFFVYVDDTPPGRSDRHASRRKALASLWDNDRPPPGCGQCLALADIGYMDLSGWLGALDRAFVLERFDLDADVGRLFEAREKLPALHLEQELRPVTSRFCRDIRPAS